MEIILSKQCESITGSLGQDFGYHIQSRTDLDGKKRFWGVRKSKGAIPPDGHLRFIFACAEIARCKLHIADIIVPRAELACAIIEAGKDMPLSIAGMPLTLNAAEVLAKRDALSL